MSRICPDCTTALTPRTFQDVTVDVCPKCAGIFFDEGEVGRVKAKGPAALRALDDAVTATAPAQHAVGRARLCPTCRKPMEKFHYLYHSTLVLDECPKCGGIWVQDGELKQMSEILVAVSRAGDVPRGNH